MAEYDPQLCEDYVRRALELGPASFVRLWVFAAEIVSPPRQLDAMVVEWQNMRPWDRQGVLFLMAKHIDEIARQVAVAAASRARVQDPI